VGEGRKASRESFREVEKLSVEQDIEVGSKIKTEDMQSYLLQFVSLGNWQESIKELKENIRPRLIEIIRHLRESA